MNETVLTADRILDAAEECLRRFGPQKATVVDVARALSVSHGAIYRHYASKESLREAVVSRWLQRDEAALQAITARRETPPKRLRRWLEHMIQTKRKRVQDDPELFETYCELVKDQRNLRELIEHHLELLHGQLTHIIADGVAQKQFSVDDPAQAARAVFFATVGFHHPMLVKMQSECPASLALDEAYESVLHLIMKGLGYVEV